MKAEPQTSTPTIRTVGLTGINVCFSENLSEIHNRAALAFGDVVKRIRFTGVEEVSTTLTSVFLRFDPKAVTHDTLIQRLQELLASETWTNVPLPAGRKFWRVPTVYGSELAPQLGEAADMAGLSEEEAVTALGAARVRVLTIGFAPGQPYLGPLGSEWNISRQNALTPQVPAGALVLAISQFVLFTAQAPTGWRHVGQTGFRSFAADHPSPFRLQAGDEMQFFPVAKPELLRLTEADPDTGGAIMEEIAG